MRAGFWFTGLEQISNLQPILEEMRSIKSADEIRVLRSAAYITADALNEAFEAAEPGLREHDLAAIIRYVFDLRDAKESFLQVASGPNAPSIHFGETERKMEAGDLIVFDVGAWFHRYTSDISRTIPASGRFTMEQKQIYDIVLRAQKQGIKMMAPGNRIGDTEKMVGDVLIDGLQKLGLITDTQKLWQRLLFLRHGFSHYIGLDIHDVYNYYYPRMNTTIYAPGMVMTVEPGLYFPENMLENVPERIKKMVSEEEFKAFADKVRPVYRKYANIGVRIEDDVLITEKGNDVLTVNVPREVHDIEKLMKAKSQLWKIPGKKKPD